MHMTARMWGAGTAALLCAGFAWPVWAADLPPAATPSMNWTGFYIGADAGAGFMQTQYQRPSFPPIFINNQATIQIGNIKPQPTYGLHAGFNYQIDPRFVLGLEAAFMSFDGGKYQELGPTLDFLQVTRGVGTLSGRVGFLTAPETMVYAKFGPAWIDTRGYQGFGGTFSKTLNGVQGGVGIETFITPNISLRAEADYVKATDTLALNTGFDLYRPSFMQIALGATYKFDAPAGWGSPGNAGPGLTLDAKSAPMWTGFEIGGFGSLNGAQMKYFDSLLIPSQQGPYTDLNIGGGGFVGFNYQFLPSFVAGIEASGDWQHANFNTANGFGGQVPNITYYRFASVGAVYAVTGRVGWLASPDTLLYIKGGPAWLQMSSNRDYWNAVAMPNTTSSKNIAGYQIGAGAETFVTSNVSVRVEALFTPNNGSAILQGAQPNEYTLKPSMLAATVGVAVHF